MQDCKIMLVQPFLPFLPRSPSSHLFPHQICTLEDRGRYSSWPTEVISGITMVNKAITPMSVADISCTSARLWSVLLQQQDHDWVENIFGLAASRQWVYPMRKLEDSRHCQWMADILLHSCLTSLWKLAKRLRQFVRFWRCHLGLHAG